MEIYRYFSVMMDTEFENMATAHGLTAAKRQSYIR